jgi:prepilin-type N-terminal cleavage/methylation domain-containing protein
MKNTSGFTLLELLIVIGMIGVLGAIGFTGLGGLRRSLALDEAGANLSQQIQRARAQSMSTSSSWRVRITDSDTFVLEQDTSTTATPTWTNRNTIDLPSAMTFGNAANTVVSFTSKGLGLTTNPATIQLNVDGNLKTTLWVSLIGTIKTVKQ